mmetsp:Transcript_11104/g.21476  ORF Transcript_11104/g.21476 Transcript_11104/m.21476 type:complete len:318 (-) Transcript_11104:188-1141(-)
MALPLDEYGYSITAIITVAMQLACFAVAYTCSFDLLTDLAGSTNFIVLALLTLALGPGGASRARPVVLSMLLTAARLELALFLLYRVCRRKKDARFDEIRENCGKFLGFWVFQMLWAWFVSLPVIFVNSVPAEDQPPLGIADVLGWIAFVVGFAVQAGADIQKYQFRADPANRGKFCASGFWSISRHPNYFGEIAMWWGIWVSACTVVAGSTGDAGRLAAGIVTLLGPLWTMVILLFVSGLPFSEGASLARYFENEEEGQRWRDYREQTSPIVPLPTSCYARLPMWIKRCALCEFGFLEYEPTPRVVRPGPPGNGPE